ncbi:hypothetical protein BX600DRAFT_464840 [Xylariales sp. PMI_506]|nr:hypothetical protein BX600DRAFT_464840 [Xylariales sp. PMI_506]
MFQILSRWFGGKEDTPTSLFDSEDVYPLHIMDDYSALHSPSIGCLMRFDDVLDADKLHRALESVLEIGDWRKLGGRLRFDKAGKLKLHVPRPFTAQHPAVTFTHQSFDVAIEEHNLGRQLPRATSAPSVQPNIQHFGLFLGRPGNPICLKDYLESDDASISLHVTSFEDATLVGVCWPHPLMDGLGFATLILAWCKVLAGNKKDVPPLLGAREDIVLQIQKEEPPPTEPFLLEGSLLSGLSLVLVGLRILWQILWRPKVGTRLLCIPGSYVTQLRERALADLDTGTFLSDGDLLSAWLARLIALSHSRERPGPVAMLNLCDFRDRMPSVIPTGVPAAYVQNMVLFLLTILTSSDLRGRGCESLGSAASKVRKTVEEQTTEAQMKASLRMTVEQLAATGRPPVFGRSDAMVVVVSNWNKAKLAEIVDFSPALAVGMVGSRGAESEQQRPGVPRGKMVYHMSAVIRQEATTRNAVFILGKDLLGNYWASLYMAEDLFGPVQDLIDSGFLDNHSKEN